MKVKAGHFYIDCKYDLVLCLEGGDSESDSLLGVSLYDGRIGYCSPRYCVVKKYTSLKTVKKILMERLEKEIDAKKKGDNKI